MELLSISQYVGTGLGILSIGMLSIWPKTILVALAISTVSCAIMFMYGFITQQYGIGISQGTYVILNLVAIYNWKKREII